MENQFDNVAHIEVVVRSNASDISNELLRLLSDRKYSGKARVVIKHTKNEQDSGQEQRVPDNNSLFKTIYCPDLSSVTSDVMKYDVIGIDQGHLFGNIADFCDYLADNGKIVIVAALDGTPEGKSYDNISNLIPRSEIMNKPSSNYNVGEGSAGSSYDNISNKEIGLENVACLIVLIGAMFAGKTTGMLEWVKYFEDKYGKKGVVIKHPKDTRDKIMNKCKSRPGLDGTEARTHEAIVHENIETTLEQVADCDVVGIDEGQFFDDLVDLCNALLNAGKTVIVAALDGDFERKPFGETLKLVPIATEMKKLWSRCCSKCEGCSGAAAFTRLTPSGSVKKSGENGVVLIGDKNEFEPVCRLCYKKCKDEERRDNSSHPEEGCNNCLASNGDG